jgi:hypothetical protein
LKGFETPQLHDAEELRICARLFSFPAIRADASTRQIGGQRAGWQ